MKKYFLADNVFIYPSSNAKDRGSENSERNLAKITDKFTTQNFVVRNKKVPIEEDTSLLLKINDNGNLVISPGACVIDGYYLEIKETEITVDSIMPRDVNGNIEYPVRDTQYNVNINLHYDGAGNVRGDSGTATEEVDTCYGVSYDLVDVNDLETSLNPSLTLGTVIISSSLSEGGSAFDPNRVSISVGRFSYIDIESIHNGQGLSLEDTINLALKRLSAINYWSNPDNALDDDYVSDTCLYVEAGKLMFRSSPLSNAYNLLDSFKLAPEGETTEAGTLADTTENNNGYSELHARADHDHDNRYILDSTKTGYVETQNIASLAVESVTLRGQFLLGKGMNGIIDSNGHVSLKRIDSDTGNIGGSSGLHIEEDYLTYGGPNPDSSLFSIKNNKTRIGTNLEVQGTITGTKVYNAVWNDYAEAYKKADPEKTYEPGTVIAKVKGSDCYDVATYDNRKLVIGVVSDSYGMLLGGDKGSTEEETLKKYIPIALSGRVYVKVYKGSVIEEGDLLYQSAAPGRVTTSTSVERGTILGKALESTDGTKDKILMQVILG